MAFSGRTSTTSRSSPIPFSACVFMSLQGLSRFQDPLHTERAAIRDISSCSHTTTNLHQQHKAFEAIRLWQSEQPTHHHERNKGPSSTAISHVSSRSPLRNTFGYITTICKDYCSSSIGSSCFYITSMSYLRRAYVPHNIGHEGECVGREQCVSHDWRSRVRSFSGSVYCVMCSTLPTSLKCSTFVAVGMVE